MYKCHILRLRHVKTWRKYFKNTSAPPCAQRRRCLYRPRMVSGINTQHKARGSYPMRLPSTCNFQLMSMSSVIMSLLQPPTSIKASRLKAQTTPETVKIEPKMDCERLIKPMMELNSATCSLPSKVERLRTRGLPVTATNCGLFSKACTMKSMASMSKIESPSMHTTYLPRAYFKT